MVFLLLSQGFPMNSLYFCKYLQCRFREQWNDESLRYHDDSHWDFLTKNISLQDYREFIGKLCDKSKKNRSLLMIHILEPGEGLQDKVMRKHLLSLGLMRDGLIDTQPPQFSSPSIHQRAVENCSI